MPKRLYNFRDPVFNEWMFDFFMNLNAEEKQVLNHTEIRLIRDRRAIQEFVSKGNLEKKLTILTKLDVQWHFLFYKQGRFEPKMLKEYYRQYSMKGKKTELIDQLFRDKTFVFSSKDVATALAMMNQNVHTTGYILNAKFHKFSSTIKNLRYLHTKDPNDMEYKTVKQALDHFSKIMLEIIIGDDLMSFDKGLTPMDIAILCLLNTDPNNYFRMDYIRDQIKVKYKPLSIGIRCAYLWKELGMIDRMPSNEREPSYKIMQGGILAIGNLANRIINNAETR